MVTCQYCRAENRADATYCNNCGAALKPTQAHVSPTFANATGHLAPQSQLRGRYVIVQLVGRGGMAAVYRGLDLRNNATVAIKEMSQDGLSPEDVRDALESFHSEARMLSKLRHYNLPRVYESFEENARQYLVMDFIEGKTLEQRQQEAGNGPLPVTEVLGWAKQLCSVLGYLHSQKPPIIFRDLKPANIMVTRDGQIKLIDFGIARVFAPGHARDTQVLGTPGYAPPEQYGKTQTDPRADIYALGCTLYHLLSGYDPATTPFQLPPLHSRVPGIPAQVERAIEHATRLDRDQRPATVADFSAELLGPAAAPRPTMPYQAARPSAPHATSTHSAAHAAPTAPVAPLVQPQTLDFGLLLAGQQGTLSITISAPPGMRVRGKIKPLSRWISVDAQRFDGPSTIVRVTVDTHRISTRGLERGTIQIDCGSQHIYVPVSVSIAAVSAPAQAGRAQAKPAKTRAPRPAGMKYAQPAPPRSTLAAFLTAGTLAAIVTMGSFHALGTLVTQTLRWPESAPVLFAQMLIAAALAALAAVLSSGGPHWRGRLGTSLVAAYAGLALALMLSITPPRVPIQQILTATVRLPVAAQIVLPALIGAGAALGASRFHSQWMLRTGAFIRRYLPFVVNVAGVVGGAYAGFIVTQQVLYGCLVPFGIGGGIVVGLLLARIVNGILRRTGRMPKYAQYPHIPRYRPYSRWP